MALGLRKGALPVPPTTAYLMVGNECINNCAFCTQAREAQSSGDLLSRVIWPEFDLETALKALEGCPDAGIKRICFQCLIDPTALGDLPELISIIADKVGIAVSISISAVDTEMLKRLKDAGASRVGIALDGASRKVFDEIKGRMVGNPYTWEGNWTSLRSAIEVFGRGNVSTHVIIGIGESDKDVVRTLVECLGEGILVSLFAYTPMKGTKKIGKAPELSRYRALQLARSLVMDHGMKEGFRFDENGRLTGFPGDIDRVDPSLIFQTRGCPDCNRPYYNERPRGPMYNYPKVLDEEEASKALSEALAYILV